MKPGLHRLSYEEYHSDRLCPVPSLSASIAELLVNRSAAHAYAAHPRLGNSAQNEDNAALDVGKIAHALLFEGLDKMAVLDFKDWRTNAAKEARDEAKAAGQIAILRHQEDGILAMCEAAEKAWLANPDLAGYPLADGDCEATMLWRDGDTFCRAKPDYMSPDRKLILDGKFTGTSAQPDDFSRQMARMSYDLRAAFYVRGVRALYEVECQYVFMVAEDKPPYAVTFVGADPSYIALGADKVNAALDLWADCIKSGQWPAYTNRIHWVSAPPWAEAAWVERGSNLNSYDPELAGES